jgi:hypothetical protein
MGGMREFPKGTLIENIQHFLVVVPEVVLNRCSLHFITAPEQEICDMKQCVADRSDETLLWAWMDVNQVEFKTLRNEFTRKTVTWIQNLNILKESCILDSKPTKQSIHHFIQKGA